MAPFSKNFVKQKLQSNREKGGRGRSVGAGLDFAVGLEFEAGIEPGTAESEVPRLPLCHAAMPFSRATSYKSAEKVKKVIHIKLN